MKNVTTNKVSDVVLVYDRYYNSKPYVLLQSLKKILLCCGITVFSLLFLVTEYGLPVSLGYTALMSGLFSLIISVLFIFVKKRFAISAMAIIAGVVVFFNREELWRKLSYFVDAALLSIDGRLVDMKDFVWHPLANLTENNPHYVEGVTLGFTLVCFIFAMIAAASVFRKPKVLPVITTFVLLWIPRMIAEKLEFNGWLIPAIALYGGLAALALAYREGIAIKHSEAGNYRQAAAREDRAFAAKAAKTPFLKRAKMTQVHYSKYFSLAVYAGALFTAGSLIANSVLGNSGGINYSGVYDLFGNMGGGITSPFEEGPVSEYFSGNGAGGGTQGSGLGISSPGQGEQEILRVTNSGKMPLYLRGDIGAEFDGKRWSSPVTSDVNYWKLRDLSKFYRPAEMRVIKSIADGYYGDSSNILTSSDVTVDYLCNTDVVFLPAYTAEFGYYENEMFDVYGDFAVRVNDSYDNINTVKCKALIPRFTYTGPADRARGINALEKLEEISFFDDISVIYDTFLEHDGIMEDYNDYVYNSYMSIPASVDSWLSDFVAYDLPISAASYSSVAMGYYSIAMEVSDFLQNNYTYSLSAKNNTSDPLRSFLTETKSGHCALYASSMTLIMRELGIPARYCTGFVARAGAQNEVLKSKHLHAWCEVYIDSIGWVTFDPTSAAIGNTTSEPVSSSSDSESSISEIDESSEPASSETPPETSSEQSSENSEGETSVDESVVSESEEKVNVLPYLLIIAGIVIIMLAAVLLIMRYRQLDSYAAKRLSNLKNGEIAYSKILAIAAMFGIKPNNGELPVDFYERLDKALGIAISEQATLLEKAAFGKLGDEESAKLVRILRQVFAAADKKAKGYSKAKLRKIVVQRTGK